MTAEFLASVSASILSLLFGYLPKLSDWYAAQTRQGKAGVMAVALVGVTVAVFAFSCLGIDLQLGFQVYCTSGGALALGKILFAALVSNQSTFQLFVDPYKVQRRAPAQPQIVKK